MQIVSLALSTTEIIIALGCQEYLVAIHAGPDKASTDLEDLPRLEPFDLDELYDLDPDLVIMSLSESEDPEIIDSLEASGLEFLITEALSLEDVLKDIRVIGHALGVAERAEEVIASMRSELKPQQYLKAKPKVLVLLNHAPLVAPAKYHWVNDMLALAGANNALALTRKKWVVLEDDAIAFMNPDIIILSLQHLKANDYQANLILEKASLQDLKAVKQRQVFCVDASFLAYASPSLVKGSQALKAIIRDISIS